MSPMIERPMPLLCGAWLALACGRAAPKVDAPSRPIVEADSDGDGLSDFQEVHKYRTDPKNADSDGDGIPDGDWNERREFTYTVRSVVQVMPPVNVAALDDDYQDARVLEERSDYAELEVIHYPLNTNSEGIDGSRSWETPPAALRAYLRPGVTTDWDDRMRADLIAALARDGIDLAKLTDRDVVEKVSAWALARARTVDPMFTTYDVWFPRGRPEVYPGAKDHFDAHKGDPAWSVRDEIEHDVLGREMYYHRTRGSCTSTAVYLTTVLRAVGIPTRMIIVIPVVDASDERELEMVEHLSHHEVRQTILDGIGHKESFASHTFNEVWVGGRWRRLNYNHLGENTLGAGLLGLMTHVNTFSDLAETSLAPTWGDDRRKHALFGHANPYSTISLSDHFGPHANVPSAAAVRTAHEQLTISKLYWAGSEEQPAFMADATFSPPDAGHLLAHVDERIEVMGKRQYDELYGACDPRFVFKAPGHEDVRAEARRGHWSAEFYIQIAPNELKRMVPGVTYTLLPLNERPTYHWVVKPGVTLVRPQP
jgi:transglutaminase superfamily protein/thrombospondin type 3 repeat protein